MSDATEVGAFSLFTGEHAADPFPAFPSGVRWRLRSSLNQAAAPGRP